jgi:SARP family transcriptional regulator, regulator of embCAB operon
MFLAEALFVDATSREGVLVRDIDITVRHEVTGLTPRPRPLAEALAPVRFTLLGGVGVRCGDAPCAPPPSRQQQVLALLLMRPGCLVRTDTIVHELWADAPPGDARVGVRSLVHQLRRHLEQEGVTSSGRSLLVSRPAGYVLRVEPGQVDLCAFRDLVGHGAEAFRSGHPDRAAELLRSGLALWSGAPFAGARLGPVLTSCVVKLEQEHRTARHLRIQADIDAGRREHLIGELRGLVTSDPLDEGSHAQLMQVLGFAGRRSEALALYRRLRERLIEELGLEPCEGVQQQYDHLLRTGGLSAR